MINRKIRLASWVLILALAGFQAYAQRYAVSPDGMSYLDLSDAVTSGRLGAIINLYWSPLYPFLIGLARLVSGAGPRSEVVAIHAVNVLCFAALFGAFEYFLFKVLEIAARSRRVPLRGAWGQACAYALFGTIALTLNPLELTTPDLLSNAAILVALGALLRLHDGDADARRNAVVLGAALGLGLLAKSFLVPWAFVCFATLAVVLRGRGLKPLGTAVGVWLVFAAPWTAVLSARAGRLTFGDAGRLTYIWYVNNQDAPSLRIVPPGARTAQTDMVLPGVGVTGDAPGTDPMWFDPARWNAPLRARLSWSDQKGTFTTMLVTFVGSIAVLTFLALFVIEAPRGSRRRAWRRAWPVLLPSIAGILAYTMVIITARYVMAFVLAGVLVVLATVPIARRIRPTLLLLGLVVSLAPLAIDTLTRGGFSLAVGVCAAMFAAVIVPIRRHVLWMVMVPLALVFSILALPPTLPAFMRGAAAFFTLGLWVLSRRAIRAHRTNHFATSLQAGLAVAIGAIFVGRLGLRIVRDVGAADRAGAASPEWQISEELHRRGIPAGAHIALVGPHAESYWARTARVKIVANVPDPLAPFWWTLPPAHRDSLLAVFARNGAQVAIATRPPAVGSIDSSWVPLRYGGWMRPLPRR